MKVISRTLIHTCTSLEMSTKVFFVVFVCFFTVSAKATYCTYSSECLGDSHCCEDGVCRETCHFCSNDFQCGTDECCDSHGDCKSDCSSKGITAGSIIAIVVGCVLFVVMVLSFVACLCCSWCPYYRRRHGHTGVVVHPPGYQQFGSRPRPQRRIQGVRRLRPGLYLVSTRQTSQNSPSSGSNPRTAGYDPPPNSHGEPPPPYYPQPQTGSYPSPQAQGTASYPSSEASEPTRYPPLQV